MKGKILFVSLIVLLSFVFGCDFVRETQTQIHTPEVFILFTNPHGFVALYDSSGVTVTVTAVNIDSVTFVSWNGVDAILKGYQVKFYVPDEDTGTLIYTSPIYGLSMYLFSSSSSDTVKNTLFNIPVYIQQASNYLLSNTNVVSIRMRVIFFGTDAYGYNEPFEVYSDYALIKLL